MDATKSSHKRRADKWIMEQINTREMPLAKMLQTKMRIVRTKLFALNITKTKSIVQTIRQQRPLMALRNTRSAN
jgi:hypothetical protein